MAKKDWHLWAFAGFLLLTLLLRYPLLGVLSYGENHWWSAMGLNFSSNWVEEGFFYLKGMLYNQAGSVEFSAPSSRSMYYSATPVFVFPLFALAKLVGQVPSIWMVNVINFVLHGTLAYLIGQLAYTLAGDLKEKYRRIAFLGAAFGCLFTYHLVYFYSAIYWTDQLVLPIVAGILLCEFRMQKMKANSRLPVVQQVLIFLATIIDYYGLFVSLTLLIYHAVKQNRKRVIELAYPCSLGFALILLYFSKAGLWVFIKGQVFGELWYNLEGDLSLTRIIVDVFVKFLGFYALAFVVAFGIAEGLQRKKILSGKALLLFFLPPVIFSLIFANKTAIVEFASLKFYLPIFVFVFGLLPALFWAHADSLSKKKKSEKYLYVGVSFVPALATLVLVALQFPNMLKQNNTNLDVVENLKWIKSVSQPEQVIFSNQITVNFLPPQGIYIVRKPVWRFGGAVGVSAWYNIFRDAVDYPLLWLEKAVPNTPACIKMYKAHGATEVGNYQDVKAFLYPSVKSFTQIKDALFEKCVAPDGVL